MEQGIKFTDVTEMAGEEISAEQLQRMLDRYGWAVDYCKDKDVIEVACGSGQGLGYLARHAKSVIGGDISDDVLVPARAHYGDTVQIDTIDAMKLPYADASADTILMFEALYYVPDAKKFFAEAARILRPGGHLLIVSANRDLYDFNPSPYSHVYYSLSALNDLLPEYGFEIVETAGGTPLAKVSLKQKILRPVKRIVVSLGLMPKTMAGKKLLKRLVFGQMVKMPVELTPAMGTPIKPDPVPANEPCMDYKVIYLAARKK